MAKQRHPVMSSYRPVCVSDGASVAQKGPSRGATPGDGRRGFFVVMWVPRQGHEEQL